MIKIFIINVSIFVESFIILKTVYLFRNKTIDCNLQKIRNNQYYKVNVFSVIFHLLFILIFLLMFQNEVSLFDNYILIIVPAMFIMVLSCLWLVRYIFVYKTTKYDVNKPDLHCWNYVRADVFNGVYITMIFCVIFDEYSALFYQSVLFGSSAIFGLLLGCYCIYLYISKST